MADGLEAVVRSLNCHAGEGAITFSGHATVTATGRLIYGLGSEECKIEWWEFTTAPGMNRIMSTGELIPQEDADGDPIHVPEVWSEVGNRLIPSTDPFFPWPSSIANAFASAVRAADCPGSWTYEKDDYPFINGFYADVVPPPYVTWVVVRLWSGCVGGADFEVRMAWQVAPGVCSATPREPSKGIDPELADEVPLPGAGDPPALWPYYPPGSTPPHYWEKASGGGWHKYPAKYW
jgi:hypothetical protein